MDEALAPTFPETARPPRLGVVWLTALAGSAAGAHTLELAYTTEGLAGPGVRAARLPEALEVAAYYVVSESLADVAKDAGASSARVEVTRRPRDLLVEVADDGVGGADESRGTGLRGLGDRVEVLGGTLRVWSPSGGGTRVRAEIPCAP